ncbi:MAG: class I SAM-dependent methyltransferase [archaeon]|nr:class I SAM-dependent methyltransferase [archaeon]
MPKKPVAKTLRIEKNLRRNPQAPHVQKYHQWREKKGKPKAILASSRNQPFSEYRVLKLLEDQDIQSDNHLIEKMSKMVIRPGFITEVQRQDLIRTNLEAANAYNIAMKIVKDFKHTRGLKVLGIGVGYGQILFLLKHFMKAKVSGIELGDLSDFHKRKKLGIKYNTDAAHPSIRGMGKFDVIYSSFVFDYYITDLRKAYQIFENMEYLTRQGGKNYHIIERRFFQDFQPLIKDLGFSNIAIENYDRDSVLVTMTKIRD